MPKYFCCKQRTSNRIAGAVLTFVLILQAVTGSFLQDLYLLNKFSPRPTRNYAFGWGAFFIFTLQYNQKTTAGSTDGRKRSD